MTVRTVLALLLASLAAYADPAVVRPESGVAIDSKIETLQFTDIRYLPRTLDDLRSESATVLVFTSVGCPLVQRYLPRLVELDAEYRDRGVTFVGVNVSPNDTILEVAHQAVEYGVPFPMVKDMDGAVVDAIGALRTPEVAVLDSDRVLRYRGRIDDQYRLGGVAPEATHHYLRDAIEAVLAGKPVETAETPVEGCLITKSVAPEPRPDLTYAKDIAPIIYKHCLDCHRPGGAAPFTLMHPRQVEGRADTIAEVVLEERMPPWYGHREHGPFINERGLSHDEKERILAWVRAGAPLGDLDALPEPPSFPETEWAIGEPDLVLEAEKPFEVPATGYVPYEYITLPYVFPHDTWVQGIEIKPSNPTVVHHANIVYSFANEGYDGQLRFLTGKVPGGLPVDLKGGQAMMIPANAVLTLQVHYVTTGKPETDRIAVGLRYAEGVIDKQIRYLIINDSEFAIAPGARAHELTASETLDCDADGIAMFAHMHLRGKDFTFRAVYPDGRNETLLTIPNYSFDWQMSYLWPPGTKTFPKGTRIECTAHYDNSAFNPYNPDPNATVEYGDQTYHEMMFGYFFYTDAQEHLALRVDGDTGRPAGEAVAQFVSSSSE